MKRHLNTSYRLVWNHITGTLVVASELARSRGKRTGVAVALSLAAVTSVPVTICGQLSDNMVYTEKHIRII